MLVFHVGFSPALPNHPPGSYLSFHSLFQKSGHSLIFSHHDEQPTNGPPFTSSLPCALGMEKPFGDSALKLLTAHFIIALNFHLMSTDQTQYAVAPDRFLLNKLLCFTWFKVKLLFGF